MLFIDKKQVTREELCKMFKIDLAKIEKNPLFEVAKDRQNKEPYNGGRITSPAATGMMAYFMAPLPNSSKRVEIRYATGQFPRTVGDRIYDDFEPKRIRFSGASENSATDLDLAVYFFIHPNNTLSPIRKIKTFTEKPKYEFVDLAGRAATKMSGFDQKRRAMNHAEALSGVSLILTAKGLGLQGIDLQEDDAIRVDIMDFADRDPATYLQKVATQITQIDGMILHLIDKQYFVVNQVAGETRRWSWGKGPNAGETIVDVINVTQDAKVALKNYIKQHINDYNPVMKSIIEDMTNLDIEEKTNAYVLEQIEDTDTVSDEQQDLDDEFSDSPLVAMKPIAAMPLPTTFNESKAYLKNRNDGKMPSVTQASVFLKALQAGSTEEDAYSAAFDKVEI